MSEMREPSDCRYCGAPAEVVRDWRPGIYRKKTEASKYWYMVECTNEFKCSMHPQTGWYFTRDGALNAWEGKPPKKKAKPKAKMGQRRVACS